MERKGGADSLSLVKPLHTVALGLAYIEKVSSGPCAEESESIDIPAMGGNREWI
jgi:hypothetical protein